MTRKIPFLIQLPIFIFLFCGSSMAFSDCMQNTTNNEEINICQHTLAKQVEYKLRQLSKAIITRFEGEQELRFIQAQTQWRAMMKKDCALESDFFEGADVYPAILSRCMQNHYQSRITQISNYLCPEHSLSQSCDRAEKFFEQVK